MSKVRNTKLPAFVKNDKEGYTREIETIKTIIERTAVLKSYYDKFQADKTKQKYKELTELRKMLFDFTGVDEKEHIHVEDKEVSDSESDHYGSVHEEATSECSESEESDEEYDY